MAAARNSALAEDLVAAVKWLGRAREVVTAAEVAAAAAAAFAGLVVTGVITGLSTDPEAERWQFPRDPGDIREEGGPEPSDSAVLPAQAPGAPGDAEHAVIDPHDEAHIRIEDPLDRSAEPLRATPNTDDPSGSGEPEGLRDPTRDVRVVREQSYDADGLPGVELDVIAPHAPSGEQKVTIQAELVADPLGAELGGVPVLRVLVRRIASADPASPTIPHPLFTHLITRVTDLLEQQTGQWVSQAVTRP